MVSQWSFVIGLRQLVGWDKLASGERRPTILAPMVGLRSLRDLVPPYEYYATRGARRSGLR